MFRLVSSAGLTDFQDNTYRAMTIDGPSTFAAFLALVRLTFQRQWRVRSLGWVTAAILALMAAAVGVVTHVQQGWRLETRKVWIANIEKEPGAVRMTHAEYAVDRLPLYLMIPTTDVGFGMKVAPIGAYIALLHADAARRFRDEYAFINYSRWVVFGAFQTFLLPLFTLAFASAALGAEREGRTLIWLVTRPLPRWAVYLAKFLGVLPWCLAVNLASFVVLMLAGGELGRRALVVYWPTMLVGTLASAALFHLIGALFRRPAVVGLVYIFFFETLVANLPGSLKRLSLNYYVRSLLYHDATTVAGTVKPDNLDVYFPMGPESCWTVLLLATLVITALGAWLFSLQEPRDEV
jgi:ABC-2 type transport system permease protein